MAGQLLNLNTGYTAPLSFTDDSGNPSPVLSGETVTLSVPANGSATLSADFKNVNVTLTVAGDVDLTVAGQNDAGAPVSATVTLTGQSATAGVTTTVSIGTFVPGTTA